MSWDWWQCNRCGERRLVKQKGGRCILTPRCEGTLTVGPFKDPGVSPTRRKKGS